MSTRPNLLMAASTDISSRAPVLRGFHFDQAFFETARADDDLIRNADEIHAGEFRAGTLGRVVVENIAARLGQLRIKVFAGAVGRRIARLQIDQCDIERRDGSGQMMPASSWLASMIAPTSRETPMP